VASVHLLILHGVQLLLQVKTYLVLITTQAAELVVLSVASLLLLQQQADMVAVVQRFLHMVQVTLVQPTQAAVEQVLTHKMTPIPSTAVTAVQEL
jgi:hypothetical protein